MTHTVKMQLWSEEDESKLQHLVEQQNSLKIDWNVIYDAFSERKTKQQLKRYYAHFLKARMAMRNHVMCKWTPEKLFQLELAVLACDGDLQITQQIYFPELKLTQIWYQFTHLQKQQITNVNIYKNVLKDSKMVLQLSERQFKEQLTELRFINQQIINLKKEIQAGMVQDEREVQYMKLYWENVNFKAVLAVYESLGVQ
ncbi:Homeobox-like_domain superfamily [Hexamita inflata]|uniref:Homeobox-like domain superfamily n=1 Tax=Hexamita inflata TaxID=28002 RepID=A0AA86UCP0_9EUKA|nr:Homeobox-like domain superfamily [Hexamita inflata]